MAVGRRSVLAGVVVGAGWSQGCVQALDVGIGYPVRSTAASVETSLPSGGCAEGKAKEPALYGNLWPRSAVPAAAAPQGTAVIGRGMGVVVDTEHSPKGAFFLVSPTSFVLEAAPPF